VLVAGVSLALGLPTTGATADTPSPSPTPTTSPSPSPTPSLTPSSPSPSAEPTPTPTPTPTAIPTASPSRRAAAAPALTLAVTPGGSPQPGRFFEDIGYFAYSGSVHGTSPTARVEVYAYGSASRQWSLVARSTASAGRWSTRSNVGAYGTATFRATLGGRPGTAGAVTSAPVAVRVADAGIVLAKPPSRVDALHNPGLSGTVSPARPGVAIRIEARRSGGYRAVGTARTDGAGRFRATFTHGTAELASYSVRASYRAANRDRREVSASHRIQRAKVLHAVVRPTTRADVAKTYRPGCPVGPSKLRTIHLNYYGYDGRMHRGLIIVRSSHTARVIRGFGAALQAGYPIYSMRNPNVWGGNDPKQMAANNTSGFNCRKVVGNPYAQSPHSYGTALDVNTVQNPYRDRNGKWWPSNGRAYIDRTPRRKGMLTTRSTLTRQLTRDDFFWGGRWYPGRDYQHFQYTG